MLSCLSRLTDPSSQICPLPSTVSSSVLSGVSRVNLRRRNTTPSPSQSLSDQTSGVGVHVHSMSALGEVLLNTGCSDRMGTFQKEEMDEGFMLSPRWR